MDKININKLLVPIQAYLFRLWLNLSVLFGIIIYLFWRLQPDWFASSRSGAQFHDNEFGWLLSFFNMSTAYYQIIQYVLLPLLIFFVILSLYIWLAVKDSPKLRRRGYLGLILSVLGAFLIIFTPLTASLKYYQIQDYRTPIVEDYWQQKATN